MANVRRLPPPPEDIAQRARELIAQFGARGAARRLRLNRELVVSAAAGCPMQEGSVLLLRERLSKYAEAA